MAAGPIFARENTADQPSGAFEGGGYRLSELRRYQPASDIDSKHFSEDLTLAVHYVERETNENTEERQLEHEISSDKALKPAEEGQSIPEGMQTDRAHISNDGHDYPDQLVMRFPRDAASDPRH